MLPTGTYCYSHLFKAILAELAAVGDVLLYLKKAKSDALSASPMPPSSPQRCTNQGYLTVAASSLQVAPCVLGNTDIWLIGAYSAAYQNLDFQNLG